MMTGFDLSLPLDLPRRGGGRENGEKHEGSWWFSATRPLAGGIQHFLATDIANDALGPICFLSDSWQRPRKCRLYPHGQSLRSISLGQLKNLQS